MNAAADLALTRELADAWASSIDGTHAADWVKELRRYFLSQWVPFFRTIEGVAARGAVKRYTNERLKRVSRSTHKKELCALRGFAEWAVDEGYLGETPPIPPPPPRAAGKPSATHKTEPVEVTESEVEAILALLPEFTRPRRGTERHRVRDVVTFWWETGLRPKGTVARLEVPRHWRPGMPTLSITADIDKAQFRRPFLLTPRALDILQRCAPESGRIFPWHDYRALLKRAAREVLGAERSHHFSAYDFRHNRADFLLDVSGDVRAVAYNHGHRLLSTTDKYLRPSLEGQRRLLAKLAERSGASTGAPEPQPPAGGCTAGPSLTSWESADTDSGPERTWRNWQTHQIQVLAG